MTTRLFDHTLSQDERHAGVTLPESVALSRRRKGYTYARIGPSMGVSASQARRLAHAAKRKLETAYPDLTLRI